MISINTPADVAPPVAAMIAPAVIVPRNAPSLDIAVNFSKDVSGVDLSDFTLQTTGSAVGALSSLTQSGPGAYVIHVTGISGEGSVKLNLNATGTGIADSAGRPITGGYTIEPPHIVHTDIRTTTSSEKIGALYVLDFGRGPDQAGLDYWNQQMAQGRSLKDIALDFAGHSRFVSDFGALNNTQFVQAIYQNGLTTVGDGTGVTYWATKLDQGESRSDMLAEFAVAVLGTDLVAAHNAGQLTDAEYQNAVLRQNTLLNRVDAGLEFVKQLGSKSTPLVASNSDPAYQASQQILANMDGSDAALANALANIDASSSIADILAKFPAATQQVKMMGVPHIDHSAGIVIGS
jgi:Domain of unknown function (DUF4214)